MLMYFVIVSFFTLTTSFANDKVYFEADSHEENSSKEFKLMQEMMKKLEDVRQAQNSFEKRLEYVEKKIEDETSIVRNLTQQLLESVEKKIDERTTNMELNADLRMEALKNVIELNLAKIDANSKLENDTSNDPTDNINEMDGLNTTTSNSSEGLCCNDKQYVNQMDFEIAKLKFDDILEKLEGIVYNTTQCAEVTHFNASYQNKTTLPMEDRCEGQWVYGSNGDVPPGAIRGDDSNSSYVGRAFHEGDLIPGKIVPSLKCLYVSYHGREHKHGNYEVLTGCNEKWIPTFGKNVIKNAIVGGHTKTGDLLYVCRVSHEGQLVVGKVHLKNGVCYIPFAGREISYGYYYILTMGV